MFMREKNIGSHSTDKSMRILNSMGIIVNSDTGELRYADEFKPLMLGFELVFIRHGETFGNCGQVTRDGQIDFDMVASNRRDHECRIFQGNVDREINQLTERGKDQAKEVAKKLTESYIDKLWVPDHVLVSPLTRAMETAQPFIDQHGYLDRVIIHHGIVEQSFGAWENRRVCDFKPDDKCHLFYKNQNALVKQDGNDEYSAHQEAENFCDVLVRANRILTELNKLHPGKKIVMFSHSMFGAACCILLHKGQTFENSNYLAFDGKKSDGTYYTMPNATPFEMNVSERDKRSNLAYYF